MQKLCHAASTHGKIVAMTVKRKGPAPLLAHLGMVVASALDWNSNIHEYAAPYFSPLKALELEDVIRGIKMYMDHPYSAQHEKGRQVWKSGSATVSLLYADLASPAKGNPVLLVPSLINTSAIFDLCAERSLARYLAERGNAVYMLDWGNTAQDDRDLDLSSVIVERLLPAIAASAEHAQKRVSVLGYCMGGTLSLAAAALEPDEFEKLILLAAPWDFRAGRNRLSERVREWAPMVMPRLEYKGYMPSDWTQTLFATLDPEGSAKKFARFSRMNQDSAEARIFVAVEDWLNEGVDLAPALTREILQQWFALNAPARGQWKIGGRDVDVARLEKPVMIVASSGDRLVPWESAEAVAKALPPQPVKTLRLTAGHIGLIAGRGAVETIWSPIIKWIADTQDQR